MDAFHELDTQPSLKDRLAAWRELPRLLVSPKWRWLTLGALALALLLIRLGTWQLDRLVQRRAQNAVVASRINEPPKQLPGAEIDVTQDEYRAVVVNGTYDPANEIVLRNRTRDGEPGMDVVTPLQIAGTDQHVLIDRGWVPLQEAERTARQKYAVSGSVTVEGIVRKPQVRFGYISPQDQQPQGGRLDAWFRPDIERIKNQMPYALLPFWIEQKPTGDARALPYPQLSVDYTDEGPHWSYALQWFSFATIGIVGYGAFVVTRTQQERAGKD